MKIAVTGASGFIGTELLGVLNKRDDVDVIALSRGGSHDSPHCEWRLTDYSFESLAGVLEGADAVIHLAGVRGTEDDPGKFAVNVRMTENILRAMDECGARRIVFASTMAVYNDDSLMPWTEDAPLRGRSRYGDSKADCEQLIIEHAKASAAECGEAGGRDAGFSYGIVRIAQVLGEGERRRGVMNVFIDTAAEKGTLKVMGKSAVRKQYIYVKDLAEIIAMLAAGRAPGSYGKEAADEQNGAGGQNEAAKQDAGRIRKENIVVNAGMPNAYTNLEIAHIVNRVFENPTPIEYDDSYPEKGRPFHMDISRLRNELGYEPLDMEEAVREVRRIYF